MVSPCVVRTPPPPCNASNKPIPKPISRRCTTLVASEIFVSTLKQRNEETCLQPKLHKLETTWLDQEYVTEQLKNWNVLLYQLPPQHEAVNTINALKEKLTFLLYCLNKSIHQGTQDPYGFSKELNMVFEELLLEPKLDILPQVKYPSLDLHESVKEFCDNNISFENTIHVMCDYLGISPKIRDSYKQIDAPFQYHFCYERWIQKYFENYHYEFDFNEQETVVTVLTNLGYTEEKAEYIVSLIDKDTIYLQSPLFWAFRYLDYSFYYMYLLINAPKFVFQSDKVNEWFEQYCDYDEDDNVCKLVKMINLTSDEAEKEKVLPSFVDCEDFVHLYHGTTYQSCRNLIRKGIRLGNRSEYQDFSSLKGFYLSEDLKDAKRWGSAGRGDSYAVLVYKVSRDFMDAEKQHGLNLTDYDQWNRVVKFCRSDYRLHLAPPEELENVSFVRGPTAAGQAYLDVQLGRDFTMGDSIQICIKDQTFAEQFGDIGNICCALFY